MCACTLSSSLDGKLRLFECSFAELKDKADKGIETDATIGRLAAKLIKQIPNMSFATLYDPRWMRPIKLLTNKFPNVRAVVADFLSATDKPIYGLLSTEIALASPLEWVTFTETSLQQLVGEDRTLSGLRPTLTILSHLGDQPCDVSVVPSEGKGRIIQLLEAGRKHSIVQAEDFHCYRLNPSVRMLLSASPEGFSDAVAYVIRKATTDRSSSGSDRGISDLFCHLESLTNSAYIDTLDASNRVMLGYLFGCSALVNQKIQTALDAFREVIACDLNEFLGEFRERIFPAVYLTLAKVEKSMLQNGAALKHLNAAQEGYIHTLLSCAGNAGPYADSTKRINKELRAIGKLRAEIQNTAN